MRIGARKALALCAALLAAACATVPEAASDEQAEFVSLFDGATLAGWRGDPSIWSVRDGAITGGSERDIPENTFLIHEQPHSDFELRYKYRLTGSGNSGFHFRSRVTNESEFQVAGYQSNVVPTDQAERFGMLWEEGGRGELALLGQRMEIRPGEGGKEAKTVLESVNPREKLIGIIRPYPEWNEVVVIAYGNRMVHAINGYLVFDAVDLDPAAPREGLFALQAHSGPPMFVQFKDIAYRPLSAAPDFTGRFISEVGPPTPAEPGPRVPRR